MTSIDVAVPCYNYGRYLRDCVESIISQDVPNLRVLIIDNGSTDESLRVAEELRREDPRVEIDHYPVNQGQKFSYGVAIDWASSKYFMILDADDVLAPGALGRALAIMDNNDAIAFCHGVELRVPFEPGSHPAATPITGPFGWSATPGPKFIHRLCVQPVNSVGASTVIIRTDAQKQAGYYNPNLTYADDVEMWLRLAQLGDVAEVECVQAVRRIHAHQLTRHCDGALVRDCMERLAAYKAFFTGPARAIENSQALYATAVRSLCAQAYWAGLSHFVRGYRRASLDLLSFAFRQRPSMVVAPPIDWLMRMEGARGRAREVVAEAWGTLKQRVPHIFG